MIGEWAYFKSRFTKEQCDYILQEGLKLPAQDATLGVQGVHTDSQFRKSKTRFIHDTDLKFSFLFDELWRMGIKANSDWFNFHITRVSYIQLAEYDESYQGEYKQHQDVFWINNDPFYHRKLTCVVQLTDPSEYEGGNFEVFSEQDKPNPVEIREQGTAIFIPSFMLHQATPVTKGTRYSLAVWFEGPKWR
jgi:PKHD-type hydroxylase